MAEEVHVIISVERRRRFSDGEKLGPHHHGADRFKKGEDDL